MITIASRTREIFQRLGAPDPFTPDGDLVCRSPIDGSELGRLRSHTPAEVGDVIGRAHTAFEQWRTVPAPVRGQFVRELGELLREHKDDLGALVSIEAGKIVSEGLGEVQEMIDICDLAVGLSRQLHGLTIATERPGHRMMEQWHPLGVIGVISAFNFPVAVWSWNAALAFVCGDAVVWKPSEKTLLTALGCHALAVEAGRRAGVPDGLCAVLIGDRTVGEAMVDDPRVPLVSATGSTRMGKEVAPRVAARLGRTLLELGGNNAAIVAPSADLDLAVRGIVFSAVGTAGQRCTSLRRVIVHESIKDDLVARLKAAYETLPIGSPLERRRWSGPLIDEAAFRAFGDAIVTAQGDGGKLVTGGTQAVVDGGGYYVHPAIIDMPAQSRDRQGRDVRAAAVRPVVLGLRRGAAPAQRGRAGPVVVDLHPERPRGRAVHVGRRLGLRHRQRQHRPVRRRDRRRVRRREGHRRRPRVRLGRVARLHAPRDQHRQLLHRAPAGPRRRVRLTRVGGALASTGS